ncbi:signal peptide peptidase SppA [Oleidesulfovibrio alaskensis]|uniref:signal peptide peptidase SppA n=1 Tax=Oleidesulfovibrio alaskensis TaxID=58180 RepID=UPI0005503561|nr:signal peptide peptidase SppA [Oleidesulfovibrio alaskensis]
MQQTTRLTFSQRHPFLFGMMLILVAVALFWGAMATLRLLFGDEDFSGGQRLGLINVQGMLLDTTPYVDFAEELRRDPDVRGVLLRVNSPGGAVAPSQELHDAVKRLAASKPVVVSMGAAAASGGYYISVPATRIVANPSTLTASIGVKMEMGNVHELMKALGIHHVALTSGELKNAGSPFAEMTPREREYLQSVVMDMYDQFVQAVAEGRHLPPEDVRLVADGRAMTGRQALQAGLVDMLGDRHTAMQELLRLCNATGELPVQAGPEEKRSILRELFLSVLPAGVISGMDDAPYRFFF